MPTAALDSAGITAFLGKPNALFYEFKKVMAQLGHQVLLAESISDAKRLLETQAIKTIVNNLDLDDENTHLMIIEFRKIRPHLKVVPGGTSLSQVVEDNFYAIARDIDGTITVDQFRTAFKKVRSKEAAQQWHVLFGIIGIACIVFLAAFWPSPYVKFVGTFWFVLLAIEFGYCFMSVKTGSNEH